MKWFFALNEKGNEFEDYAKMLKVAVCTAQKFTSLEPHFLYDGQENGLTEWLEKRNVTIFNARSFLYEQLKQIAEKRNDENFLAIGAGAFLRTEIPKITLERNITDEYILYTDLDVMFLSEVVDSLEKMSPKYFAVAPEHLIDDYRQMNSGVMLMNLNNLRKKDSDFRDFMSKKIEIFAGKAWDQDAYKLFYKTLFGYKWGKLAPEFNWKTYWKDNPNAKIIHFHGPKPHQEEKLSSPKPPAHLEPLLPLVTENYRKLCCVWKGFYSEANI